MIDKNEAPDGMIAVATDEHNQCTGCVYQDGVRCTEATHGDACYKGTRKDGQEVIFKKTDIMNTKLEEAKKIAASAVELANCSETAARNSAFAAQILLDTVSSMEADLVASELPEVCYVSEKDGSSGAYFEAGKLLPSRVWSARFVNDPSRAIRSAFALHYNTVIKACYDNARALLHGADFVGRLDQTNVPVCELNQATRDEMDKHKWDEFETLVDGVWTSCVSLSGQDGAFCDEANMGRIYRLRKVQDTATRVADEVWNAPYLDVVDLAKIIRKAIADHAAK